jgi:hypothetical protein
VTMMMLFGTVLVCKPRINSQHFRCASFTLSAAIGAVWCCQVQPYDLVLLFFPGSSEGASTRLNGALYRMPSFS